MTIDQQIVRQIRSRDQQGLRDLYSNYSGSLYGIAFRVLNSKSHAENAMQKAFFKIWDKIDDFDESKGTFFTWMAQIIKNTAIDIRRLKSFEKEGKTDSLDPHVHKGVSTNISTDNLDTDSLLSGLDEKYAFVLEHLYLKGYTQSELSKEFDIPLGTIKTRVKKGIEILRSTLTKEQKLFLGFLTLLLIIQFAIQCL